MEFNDWTTRKKQIMMRKHIILFYNKLGTWASNQMQSLIQASFGLGDHAIILMFVKEYLSDREWRNSI